MEQNSSNVCIASHRDDQKSTRLPDDAIYATIIPANTRKARLQRQQQEQAAAQTTIQKKQPVSITSKMTTTSDNDKKICTGGVKQTDSDNVIVHSNNNNYDSTSGESDDDESVELWSNEIPVYIKGEQRWISGVTEQTTCLDIIEALLIDEGIVKANEDTNNNNANGVNLYPTKVNEYVITERWRRMEQALDGRTKILKIWLSWGTEQSEVRFSLKRRSDSHNSSSHQQSQQQQSQTHTMGGNGDRDSGRGSPTGSINSAIVRRRRHRASRSTFAWMTHGQTIHPKSSKNNIERLMKLILEQGEVIQQQLAKLRDRELEITTLEEERHKVREKEHGKNYLLETYLKGLPDSDDKQELTAGNSDSGVHTEETAASPEVQHEDEISDTLIPLNHEPSISNPIKVASSSKKSSQQQQHHHNRRSKREHELLREHQSTKEYSNAISSGSKEAQNEGPINSEVAAQIDILEKLIVLNKHLQREEELCVRLSAKIKRYEADASGLTESQVKESLKRVEEQLNAKNCEIAQMEGEIKSSDEALSSKTDVLKKLYDELEEAEVEHRKLEMNNDTVDGAASISSIPPSLPPLKSEQHKLLTQQNQQQHNDELGMSREYLAENIYNISKLILKSSGQTMPMNVNNVQLHQQKQAMSMVASQKISVAAEKRVIQAQIHSIPTSVQQQQQCRNYNEAMRASTMNYLATINQRLQKSNNQYIESDINNANNPIIQATQYKLSPKKLLINTQNQASGSRNSNNNNIYKRNMILQPNDLTTQQDVSQLGTLV